MAVSDNLRAAPYSLAESIKVLPAVGGAVEFLQRPGADEIDDVLVNQDVVRIVDMKILWINPSHRFATGLHV